jgi:hypothetical protein
MSVSVVAPPGFEPVAHSSGPAELGERCIPGPLELSRSRPSVPAARIALAVGPRSGSTTHKPDVALPHSNSAHYYASSVNPDRLANVFVVSDFPDQNLTICSIFQLTARPNAVER